MNTQPDFRFVPALRITDSGGDTPVESDDVNLIQHSPADFVYDYVLEPANLPAGASAAFASSNEAAATISALNLTHVADGTTTVTMTAGAVEVAKALVLSESSSSSTFTFDSWVSGSLGEKASDAIDTRLAGKTFAADGAVYSTLNHTSSTYVRNTTSWCADIDLTSVSVWNSESAGAKSGTLISPRHVLFAKHYAPTAGATLRFVTSANATITRTLSAVEAAATISGYYPDFAVGLLDSDVPAGVAFAKVLPEGWQTRLPGLAYCVPVLAFDQQKRASVLDVKGETIVEFLAASADAARLAFFSPKVGGDSGSPVFLLINDEPVLLTVFTTPTSGSAIAAEHDIINNLMTSLGGGYQLTEADLSGFPAY